MTNSQRAWTKWGKKDPYYGVLSSEEFRHDQLTSEALDKFFATGETHIEHVFATIRSKISSDFAPRTALDYGCGTARLAIPLSGRCEKVFGIDISAAMLQEARNNCDKFGRSNVELRNISDGFGQLPGIDLAHSFITFQHIPVRIGMKTISWLVASLAPRGCMAIHVTFGRNASRLRKAVFWARQHIPGAQAVTQLLLGRPLTDPPMQMNCYPLNSLLKHLHCHGIREVYLEVTEHAGFLGAMIYGQKVGPST